MHVSYVGFMSKQKYINRERDTQKESIDSYILYLLLIITLLKLLETPRWPTKTFHAHSSSNSTANSWSTPKWTTTWLSTAASQPASVTVRMPLFSSSIMRFAQSWRTRTPYALWSFPYRAACVYADARLLDPTTGDGAAVQLCWGGRLAHGVRIEWYVKLS